MDLGAICDIIILIAAVLVAFTNIYKFFFNSGKGIKKRVDTAKEESEKAERERVINILNEVLPDILTKHDLEVRDKYKKDRHRYLCEIKDEVMSNIQDSLEAVDNHGGQMETFSEVLKELLRERIMAIYRRNKKVRQLEEHEKIELDRSYAAYKSINGNSYIDDYYTRMKTWEVVPDDYHHEQ